MDGASLTEGIVWDFQTHPEYMELVRRPGARVLNFACYVGHSSRAALRHGRRRLPTGGHPRGDRPRCAGSWWRRSSAGAAGFSTSFAYTHRGMDGLPVPSRFAERDEVEALFMAAGSTGKGVVLATAGEQCTYADMYELPGPGSGGRSPTRCSPWPTAATSPSWTCMNQATARGAQVWPQVTPRPLTMQFTMDSPFSLNVSPVFAELMDRDRDARHRRLPRSRVAGPGGGGPRASSRCDPRWETCEISESERPSRAGGPAGRRLGPGAGL